MTYMCIYLERRNSLAVASRPRNREVAGSTPVCGDNLRVGLQQANLLSIALLFVVMKTVARPNHHVNLIVVVIIIIIIIIIITGPKCRPGTLYLTVDLHITRSHKTGPKLASV